MFLSESIYCSLHPEWTKEEYRAHSAVANSDLSMLEVSPSWFRRVKNGDEEGFTSSGFKIGDLFDILLFEPLRFQSETMVQPDVSTPSSPNQQGFCDLILQGAPTVEAYKASYKTGKDKEETIIQKAADLHRELKPYLDFMIVSRGMAVYSQQDQETLSKMRSNLGTHPLAPLLLLEKTPDSDAYTQPKFTFLYDEDGLEIEAKSELDRLIIDYGKNRVHIPDLKTTGKPLYRYRQSFEEYGYYRQLAMYDKAVRQYLISLGLNPEDFTFVHWHVVVGTAHDCACRVFQVPGGWIERGRKELLDLMHRYDWHRRQNKWDHPIDTYNQGFEVLELAA